ncbi:MAG: sugar ABC transporter substrate-binding protein, partial [Geminicoccaceae bacterium]
MKKLLMCAAAGMALAAFAPAGHAQETYTFALVPKNLNNPFFDQARDGCKKAEEELKGKVKCEYIGPPEH